MFVLNEYNLTKYDLIRSVDVKEINAVFIELKHKVTKASVILIACDDKNRVFNIAFKTPVSNGKGTPHILEHSVLCGSRKYNVKDPFVELAKSSMNTFLNAMTFPDKTCYPVASANLKDFHNLVDVYLDAVFYPNVLHNDKIFKQEGWHYEIDDIKSDLKVNGVVLNEMKGVYSNPDGILESAILSNQFEGTNYEYDYGGNPSDIIELTFDEFIEFHKKFYSPSNAIIYYYGDLDFNEELTYLHDNYLKDFNYIDIKAEFLNCKNIIKDREHISLYNTETNDNLDNAYISYNFTIDRKLSTLDSIVISILDYILFSSESAVIRNRMLELGLGESIYTLNDAGLKNNIYSVISQNINIKKKDDFKDVLLKSIESLVRDGINVQKLKAGINQVYFQLEEKETGRLPKGLTYTLESLDSYLYDKDDICSYLCYSKEFEYLNSIDLEDKNNVFYKILKELFIENNHRTINILKPKFGYLKEKETELNSLLKAKKAKFNESELTAIVKDTEELKTYQKIKDSDESLKCIPSLKLDDLEEKDNYTYYFNKTIDNIDYIITTRNDSEIVYLDYIFDLTDLTKEEVYLFSIIACVLSKIDLKDMSYEEFNDYIDINTGGLNIAFHVYNNKLTFAVGLKVAYKKVDIALKIIDILIFQSLFVDKKRISILTNEIKSNAFVSILSNGHLSAVYRAESKNSFAASMNDKLSINGISTYKFYSAFTKIYADNADLIDDTLSLLYKKMLTKKLYVSLSLNDKYNDQTLHTISNFNKEIFIEKYRNIFTSHDENELNDNIVKISSLINFNDFDKKVKKEAILTPGDVNFVALSNLFDKEKYIGSLNLLRTLFSYEYLWTNIRVLGGAYGCMSYFKKYGTYQFTSYRDPNLNNTNNIYFGVYEYLKNINLSYDLIEKMIIGTIGQFDNPLSIRDTYKKSLTDFFNGTTDEMIKKDRKELLATTIDDIKKLSELFINIKDSEECAIICEKVYNEAKESYDLIWKLEE